MNLKDKAVDLEGVELSKLEPELATPYVQVRRSVRANLKIMNFAVKHGLTIADVEKLLSDLEK